MVITDYVNIKSGEVDWENLKIVMKELDKSDSIYHTYKDKYSHDTRLKAYVIKWLNDLGVFKDTMFYDFCRHAWEIPYCNKKSIRKVCQELREDDNYYNKIDDKFIKKVLNSLCLIDEYHVNTEFFNISTILD